MPVVRTKVDIHATGVVHGTQNAILNMDTLFYSKEEVFERPKP